MTHLLYQTDSYLGTFSATVTGLIDAEHAVILDQTAFFPGGGGQPADNGIIILNDDHYPVIRTRRIGKDIIHIINNNFPLPSVGTTIQGQINWDRRYKAMRTHTAMHILCGVIFRDYSASVTGGDMELLKGRMDFEFETMQKDLVQTIETAINHEVANARLIKVDILPREAAFQIPDLIRTKINLLPEGIQQVRVVEIVGLDIQADGGTHVKNTAEVGPIRILDYKSKGKINKRIYIELSE
jgi:misacylated tRNA(Ala) deacylase